MNKKILIVGHIGAGKTCVAIEALAKKLDATIVTAEEANTAFDNMPTFPIIKNPPEILEPLILAENYIDGNFLSSREKRRKAERDAKKNRKKRGRT